MQHTATHCNTLQYTATRCDILQQGELSMVQALMQDLTLELTMYSSDLKALEIVTKK